MKKKRRAGLRWAWLSVGIALFAAISAFALWLIWPEIQALLGVKRGPQIIESVPPKEKITEEERKGLEDILKQGR
jgi:hypothetical protein